MNSDDFPKASLCQQIEAQVAITSVTKSFSIRKAEVAVIKCPSPLHIILQGVFPC
jgi:hypothetical protein